tara:strand:- start:58 stop:318 length:261 start_codon:yes stop_codon:yes gene_type:complete
MGFRCELCDQWLSIFQISKLCDTCYKTRTIVKAYSAESILKSLESNFLIEDLVEKQDINDPVADDQKDYEKPKTRNDKKVFGEKKL